MRFVSPVFAGGVALALALAFGGFMAASGLTAASSTDTVTACATATALGTTVAGHTVAVDANPITTTPQVVVPDSVASNCVTATYTVSTVTTTVAGSTTASTTTTTSTTSPTTTTAPTTITFGATTPGTLTDTASANLKEVSKYTVPQSGSIVKVTGYISGLGATSGSQHVRVIVYADASGSPAALLGVSNEVTVNAGQAWAWVDFTFPTPVPVNAGPIRIGYFAGALNDLTQLRYESVSSDLAYNANAYASGASNPFGAVTVGSFHYSLYATESLSGSPPVTTTVPTTTSTPTTTTTPITTTTATAPSGTANVWMAP